MDIAKQMFLTSSAFPHHGFAYFHTSSKVGKKHYCNYLYFINLRFKIITKDI